MVRENATGLVFSRLMAVVALLCGMALAQDAAAADAAEVTRLIRQLGNRAFTRREAASKALAAIGEPALPALRQAAHASADLEVRRRCEALILAIESRLFREIRRLTG